MVVVTAVTIFLDVVGVGVTTIREVEVGLVGVVEGVAEGTSAGTVKTGLMTPAHVDL